MRYITPKCIYALNSHLPQIINNYVGQSNDSTPPFKSADDAFRLYNADANYDSRDHDQHYYDFRYGDAAFFVMDTRRHRSDITQGEETARTMLGEKQLSTLYDWLSKVDPFVYRSSLCTLTCGSLGQRDGHMEIHSLVCTTYIAVDVRGGG